MEQFPLGLFPAVAFASDRVQCNPGDVFALVTDGLSETCDKRNEEFGLDRLSQLLLENSARPLSEIFEIVLSTVKRYGKQDDDRTLLLVRFLA
jgi:sigma-B regulation protein RsbU (phosphoserine phosphatase)